MNSPRMETGTVEMVSVEWIMQNATSSIDGFDEWDEDAVDYERMVASKSGDHCFAPLVSAILSQGFRIPIVLDLANGIMHGNGHHRMSAAILLCLDAIPVYWAYNNYMSSEVSEGEDLPPNDLGEMEFGYALFE